jgi:hypothetical protein
MSTSDYAVVGAAHMAMVRLVELASEDIAVVEDNTSAAACEKVVAHTSCDCVGHGHLVTRLTRVSSTEEYGKSEDMDAPSGRPP